MAGRQARREEENDGKKVEKACGQAGAGLLLGVVRGLELWGPPSVNAATLDFYA